MLLFLAPPNKRKQLAVLRVFGEEIVGANCEDKQPRGRGLYLHLFIICLAEGQTLITSKKSFWSFSLETLDSAKPEESWTA